MGRWLDSERAPKKKKGEAPNVRLFYFGLGRQVGVVFNEFGEGGDINGNVSSRVRNGSARGHRRSYRCAPEVAGKGENARGK